MATELKVPASGESITEVTIVEWLKPEGAWAARDEAVAIIETDKANVDVYAPVAGIITKILKGAGEEASVGEVIGHMEARDAPAGDGAGGPGGDASSDGERAAAAAPSAGAPSSPSPEAAAPPSSPPPAEVAAAPPSPPPAEPGSAPRTSPQATKSPAVAGAEATGSTGTLPEGLRAPPSVRRAVRQGLVSADQVRGPGIDALTNGASARAVPTEVAIREAERVKMTRLRKTIAARLVEAQQTAAILTTFNEIDMGPVMALRREHKDTFAEKHGVKLGFMSFFVKAAIEGLKDFPQVNASIEGDEIVYHNYYDIGVAVGGGKGLVVPVIRNAERLSFAQVEQVIGDFGKRAQANKLTPEELTGGTFTISNGGVYGSLMSTPILNPPQSGILGLHAIKDRPVVRGGEIVVAPMMFVALSYDHRIVDGREAVSFLIRVKECIERPDRMLLEV